MAIQGTFLSVSAEGKVQGRPDMATISLGVQTEAPTAQARRVRLSSGSPTSIQT